MQSRHLLTIDDFHSSALVLRRFFEKQFAQPRQGHQGRFVWDYWHIPNQYTFLRTPAPHYFPAKIYRQWHLKMVQWGREFLGCHAISPPWLSCYVESCGQDLHTDAPHGPWAFVHSLTPWQGRKFSGGETQILKPWVTDYWRHYHGGAGLERESLIETVPARFNRLTVFDPRLPHGVVPVHGTSDPRAGRLVMHGWFIEPRAFFTGGLSRQRLSRFLTDRLAALGEQWPATTRVVGFASFRLHIARGGQVVRVRPLISSLRGNPDHQRQLPRQVLNSLKSWRFPKATSASQLTLPLIFDL